MQYHALKQTTSGRKEDAIMRLYITPTESISVSEHNVKLGEGVIAFSVPSIVYSKSDLWTGLKRPKNLHYLNSLWKDWRNNNHDLCPCANILEEGESTEGKIVCPNQLNPNITCRTCPLCSGGLKPGEIVYFKAHGRNKKKV